MAQTELQKLASRRGGEVAGAILKQVHEVRKWKDLLESKDENVVLKALIYLSDRAYGRPMQSTELSGKEGEAIQIQIVHVGRVD